MKMKRPTLTLFYCCSAATTFLVLSSFIGFSSATVGGQYSVNVHFVAPLITAPCTVAQFWRPPNVLCGLCFCMTGSLSRCIPQPGCSPAMNSTTTEASNSTMTGMTTAKPDNSTSSTTPSGGGGGEPPNNPTDKPNEMQSQDPNPNPTEQPQPPPEQPEASGEPSKNKLRGAKPGKSRRRRSSSSHLRRYRS